MKSILEEIRNRVEAENTTIEAVAEKFGMSKSSFYNKACGRNHFLFNEALEISEWLGMSLDELGAAIYAAS